MLSRHVFHWTNKHALKQRVHSEVKNKIVFSLGEEYV